MAALLSGTAWAQEGHLPEVEVRGPRDASIGSADSASEGAAEREVFQARPKLRPGDIIEAVPGIVATQHSGDGKANQYFLRGFNLEYFYASCTAGEIASGACGAGIDDRHVHPMEPRSARVSAKWAF